MHKKNVVRLMHILVLISVKNIFREILGYLFISITLIIFGIEDINTAWKVLYLFSLIYIYIYYIFIFYFYFLSQLPVNSFYVLCRFFLLVPAHRLATWAYISCGRRVIPDYER